MNCLPLKADSRRESAGRDAVVGWGAAIVDENGNETPITESMIARACDELARSWAFPSVPRRPAGATGR